MEGIFCAIYYQPAKSGEVGDVVPQALFVYDTLRRAEAQLVAEGMITADFCDLAIRAGLGEVANVVTVAVAEDHMSGGTCSSYAEGK